MSRLKPRPTKHKASRLVIFRLADPSVSGCEGLKNSAQALRAQGKPFFPQARQECLCDLRRTGESRSISSARMVAEEIERGRVLDPPLLSALVGCRQDVGWVPARNQLMDLRSIGQRVIRGRRRLGALRRQATRRAASRISEGTFARVTRVAPFSPQPPGTGEKISGASWIMPAC